MNPVRRAGATARSALEALLLLAVAGCGSKSVTAPPTLSGVVQIQADVAWQADVSLVQPPNQPSAGSVVFDFSVLGSGNQDFDMRLGDEQGYGCVDVYRADTMSTSYANVRVVVTNPNWRTTGGFTGPDSATAWVSVPRDSAGALGHGKVCARPGM